MKKQKFKEGDKVKIVGNLKNIEVPEKYKGKIKTVLRCSGKEIVRKNYHWWYQLKGIMYDFREDNLTKQGR